jgi:hypothetical protein
VKEENVKPFANSSPRIVVIPITGACGLSLLI